MKKDIVYSLRMNSRIKDLLKLAAEKDQRTTASLINKIFCAYLEKEGLLTKPEFKAETRKQVRKDVMLPVKILYRENEKERMFSGVVINVSSGGAMVLFPKGFGILFESGDDHPRFELCFESPKLGEDLCLDCETRHLAINDNQIRLGAAFVNPNKDIMQMVNH